MTTGNDRRAELVALTGRRQMSVGRGRATARSPGFPSCLPAEIAPGEIERREPDPVTTPREVVRETRGLLVVDPNPEMLRAVQDALGPIADVDAYRDFRVARARLVSRPPDLLVTNLRLEHYNGLHLVYLTAGTQTRSVVYSTSHDLSLGREAQAIGAFFERWERLPRAVASYLYALLPHRDRRSLTMLDRRSVARGGRRCTDV